MNANHLSNRAISQRWARGGNASNNCTVFTKLMKWKGDTQCKLEYLGSLANDASAK